MNGPSSPRLSVIVPTYNERENAPRLARHLRRVLEEAGLGDFEMLFMDDGSPDGTAAAVSELADARIRAVDRTGLTRGLAHAVIDGFGRARSEVLVVMDADLSHPPELVPLLVKAVENGSPVAVGSRYIPGGGSEGWPLKRRITSRVACWLGGAVTPVRDSTSGFFAVRRSALSGVRLDPLGFKIGLEVFAKARHGGRVVEVPYVFRDRTSGKSKFGPRMILAYLQQLVGLITARSKGGGA
ncbi:MAG: Polyprenol monophosphomannose synthase [Candidatus Omnitrophica bacterium]|nr:Polyprenol monophosphomannose synthase [Candidatus Omnitrophota bacterium]